MKLDMAILAGPESKMFLVDLTKQIDRLEKYAATISGVNARGGVAAAATVVDETETETETEENEDDDFAPAPKKTAGKTKAAKSFDDEETEEEETEVEAAEDDAPKVRAGAKAAKPKKVTLDDVNDACKARVAENISERGMGGKAARDEVLKILKKKFDTVTVSELEPEDYAAVIKALRG